MQGAPVSLTWINFMKKKLAILLAAAFAITLLLFNLPSAADLNKSNAIFAHINLGKLISSYPDISQVLGDGDFYEESNYALFSEEGYFEFMRNFDVSYVDLNCGRLFFLQEKNLWGGYRRTFVMHRDISKLQTQPIIIDNRKSQNKQFDQIIHPK